MTTKVLPPLSSVLSRAPWKRRKTLRRLPRRRRLKRRRRVKESSAPRPLSCCRTTWRQYVQSLMNSFIECIFIPFFKHVLIFLSGSPFSCGPNCRLRRSSSLPPCSTSTATVPPSTSSASTCGSSTETAGSSCSWVRPLPKTASSPAQIQCLWAHLHWRVLVWLS